MFRFWKRRPKTPEAPKMTLAEMREWFDVGGIRIPHEEQEKHLLILGDNGAGKSSVLRWHLYQIRMLGEPAIIVDLEREFLQTFYEADKDVILNPTDRRMLGWSPGREVDTIGEAESLAESFLPGEPNGLNSFFTSTARGLFVDVLATSPRDDPHAISSACAMPLAALHAKLRGRPSASAVSPHAQATAENVRATLQAATRGLGLLPRLAPTRRPFRLKDWVEDPRGWIFITTTQTDWAATKPLITAWLDVLVRQLLKREQGARPLVHVVVDELAALGRCSQIVDIATRGRKRGMAAKIATQSVSQLEKLYDRDARTLLSQPKTKILYRSSEPELAEWGSKLIGSVERRVERVNLRADLAARGQDSVTLNEDTRIVPLVLPIELQQLPDFEAYLIYGGRTTYIKPPFSRQLKLRDAYLPRDDEHTRLFKPETAGAPAPGAPPKPSRETPHTTRQRAKSGERFSLDIRTNCESDKSGF